LEAPELLLVHESEKRVIHPELDEFQTDLDDDLIFNVEAVGILVDCLFDELVPGT
jgi:hypothetical protein